MSVLIALIIVAGLVTLAWVGASLLGLSTLFGVIIPYSALLIFLLGFAWKVVSWARSPVPFRIPTTCGQQKSLPFLRYEPLESPATGAATFLRMAVEVLFFRSLFRNTKASLNASDQVVHVSSKWLWAGALAFHWSMLLIILRHLRFFLEGSPFFLQWADALDGFFQLTAPTFYLSSGVLIGALLFLFARRLFDARLRYLSLPADYFALFLLLGVAISGVTMRYLTKVNIAGVKEFTLGLVTFENAGTILSRVGLEGSAGLPFFIHLFLVSVLVAYFPFSKLMHMAGVFMSPTRNLANNNRAKRHINPWNPSAEDVHVHTYEAWEDDFREKLDAIGYQLERKGE